MRLSLILISVLCCLLECLAGAEGFQSRRYTATDGLPNHTVRDILQDSQGFVWIATLNGLSRFDGKEFSTFFSQPGNPLSLSDNRVHNLTEDHDGYLWIETTGRIYSCYDLRKGRFVRYTDGDPRQYNRIFVAEDGDVWLSNTEGGALRIRHTPGRGLKSEIFDKASGTLPAEGVSAVFEAHDGTILIGTSGGFTRVKDTAIALSEGREAIFSFFEVAAVPYAVTAGGKLARIEGTVMSAVGTLPPGVKVTGIIPGRESVTVFTDQGTWLTDLRSGKTVPHPELDIKGGEVLSDNKGRHWVYNHTGQLTYQSRKDNRWHNLHVIPPEIMGRTDHERYRVVEDGEGSVWISTYGNGLFAYREDDGSLRHFSAGSDGLIGSNSLRGMMLDATGALWLGTGRSGISTIWRDARDTRYFLPDCRNPAERSNSIRMLHPGKGGSVIFSSKDGGLYDWIPEDSTIRTVGRFKANVYSMLDDGMGTRMYGTRGDGLYTDDRHYVHSADDSASLPDDNIYFIRRDRKGRIWIGSFGGGIALMMPGSGKDAVFRSFFSDIHGRREQRHLIEDLDGRFWIGTSEGLLTFHPDSLISDPSSFKAYSKDTSVLNCNEVRFLLRDSKGNLWLATGNDGVICARTSSDGGFEVSRQYTVTEGLCNNSVQSMAEDDEGYLWIATEYGIARLNPESKAIENFIFSDHPQGNTYAEASVLKRKDGTLLFGTTRGIVSIDPRRFSVAEGSVYPLRFTGLTINGTAYGTDEKDSPLTETIDHTDSIVLKPHQDSFGVDFTVMDFRDSSRFRYSYMLEGYDKEWSAPSPEGTASFSYVPSGRYALKVRCLDGGLVVAEGQLDITIKSPWWRTPWACIIYIAVILGAIWGMTRQGRKEAAEEKRAVGESSEHTPCASTREGGDFFEEGAASEPSHLSEPSDSSEPSEPSEQSVPAESSTQFLEKLESVARENLSNPAFSVDDFAAAMNLGRAVFYRKLKEVADTTPNEYLKKMRMQEAARLLRTAPELNIAEISDHVGFSDSLYFSKCFKAEFGQSPTSYRKEH